MKEKFKYFYMDVTLRTAELSYANRLKVGAIAVKDNKIISFGYNGQPAGWDNECEVDNVTKSSVLHAEVNLIAKIASSHESSLGCEIFCNVSPCIECAKLMASAGIKKLYYLENYRSSDGLDFLNNCGIETEQLIKKDHEH